MISEQTILPVLVRNRAALKIQSAWRRYDAKIELEMRFIEQESAIAIQKIWRGFHKRSLFSYQVDSITIIQAIFRGYCARSKFVRCFEAAIAVQRVWRGFWAQLQTQLDYLDIITVQSIVRRRLAILERERRRHGILVLQRNIRRVLAIQAVKRMKYEHRLVVQREAAALTCQVRMGGCGFVLVFESYAGSDTSSPLRFYRLSRDDTLQCRCFSERVEITLLPLSFRPVGDQPNRCTIIVL